MSAGSRAAGRGDARWDDAHGGCRRQIVGSLKASAELEKTVSDGIGTSKGADKVIEEGVGLANAGL